MRRNRPVSGALLVELLIVILFFMAGSVILVRVFGKAHELSGRAGTTAYALAEAQNLADRLYSAEDPEALLQAEGFAPEAGAAAGSSVWTLQRETYGLKVTIEEIPLEGGRYLAMRTEALEEDGVIVTLPCSRYRQEGAS